MKQEREIKNNLKINYKIQILGYKCEKKKNNHFTRETLKLFEPKFLTLPADLFALKQICLLKTDAVCSEACSHNVAKFHRGRASCHSSVTYRSSLFSKKKRKQRLPYPCQNSRFRKINSKSVPRTFRSRSWRYTDKLKTQRQKASPR